MVFLLKSGCALPCARLTQWHFSPSSHKHPALIVSRLLAPPPLPPPRCMRLPTNDDDKSSRCPAHHRGSAAHAKAAQRQSASREPLARSLPSPSGKSSGLSFPSLVQFVAQCLCIKIVECSRLSLCRRCRPRQSPVTTTPRPHRPPLPRAAMENPTPRTSI
jgi:hypothetical protein